MIFDNDKAGTDSERASNKVLCRLLNIAETDLPAPVVADCYAVIDGDWETQVEADLNTIHPGLYQELVAEARTALLIKGNKNKPLVARYVAERLAAKAISLSFIVNITERLKSRIGLLPPPTPPPYDLDDEIPF